MAAKKLPIHYNRKTPIGVVTNDPFGSMIFEKFFDDFCIVTDYNKQFYQDLGMDKLVVALKPLKSSAVGKMYASKKFAEFVKAHPKRKFVAYSPVDPPYKINPLSLLMNSPAIAHAYENKRYFRDEFADLIRMPEYLIKHLAELDRAASYHELRDELGGAFVMQDEESSGSKGTHLVKNHDQYVAAVKSLKKNASGRSIVISKFIEGSAYSTQVCITRYGIFSAGVQKQLVDSPYLCNTSIDGATKWCGGELGGLYPDIVQHQAHEMATIVGSELASHGYKGIFGIDLIITPENEVYAIEINARQTGYSSLISDIQLKQGKIPFMLLHALELGNLEYEVTNLDALPSGGRTIRPYSLIIINNPSEEDFKLTKYIRPGIYKITDKGLEFEKETYSVANLRGDDRILITSRHGIGEPIGSGKRILKIIKPGKSMIRSDLNLKTRNVVQAVKEHFEIPV
jgi:hypothetical protein